MNTQDEFWNVSVMAADATLRRDAYATSHWLGVVDTCHQPACYQPPAQRVSEQFLNGTSAHYRPFSAINGGSMQADLAADTADGQ